MEEKKEVKPLELGLGLALLFASLFAIMFFFFPAYEPGQYEKIGLTCYVYYSGEGVLEEDCFHENKTKMVPDEDDVFCSYRTKQECRGWTLQQEVVEE